MARNTGYNLYMPNDMITLKAHAKELTAMLAGGRINRISAAENDVFYIEIRAKGKKLTLFVSARSDTAGIYLTSRRRPEAGIPTNFCMCLRKYLSGAAIENIEILNEDRIIAVNTVSRNELNDFGRYSLITEIMGGASNVILTDSEKKVIDAAKRVMNEKSRVVFPKAPYTLPQRGKVPLSREDASEILENAASSEEIFARLNGLSKESAAELMKLKSEIGAAAALKRMDDLYSYSGYSPVYSESGTQSFYAYPYAAAQGLKSVRTLSEAMDRLNDSKVEKRLIALRSADVRKRLAALEKKALRHIAEDGEVLSRSAKKERWLELGEILKCNFPRLKRGMSIIECYDFYNTRNIEIALNPTFSPQKNVERYFKLYSKAKGAESYAAEDKKRFEELYDRIAELKTYVGNCSSEAEFSEIGEELDKLYGKQTPSPVGVRKKAAACSEPYRTKADGFTVYVGRNSRQNERVTFSLASPDDVWLHAKGYHGGHGLILTCGKTVTDKALNAAAALVARFSECRQAASAQVDYTLRKYVRRIKGTRVTYTDYKTISVKPSDEF